MDGKTLYRQVERALGEPQGTGYLDAKTVYDCLYEAACKTATRTRCFNTTQTITTVADTRAYNLNPDFLDLAWTNADNEKFIKYSDGTKTHWLTGKPYDTLLLANQTTSVTIPSYFSITDAAKGTVLTGTETTGTAVSNGEARLTDSAATFVTSGVSAGDVIYNSTDDSEGVILAVTSNTVLQTALFHGTDNDFDLSDAYRIYPQGRFKLHFDPPPSTASHTVTIYYVQRPAPVYSLQRFYNFMPDYREPLIAYAAWKYKYIDREPNYGDAFYGQWDKAVRTLARDVNTSITGRKNFRVNFKKTTRGYQSIR